MSDKLQFKQLVELFEATHKEMQERAARSVDISLVVRNWLFGWYIVEFEQNGADRASYGKALLKSISKNLGDKIGRGFSVDNLELMRRFYLQYQGVVTFEKKSETLFRISESKKSETVSRNSVELSHSRCSQLDKMVTELASYFKLGWSHYVTLMSIDREDERRFYEIEAQSNSWRVRELKRQIYSSLYERLALSRNKEEVRKLSKQGQLLTKPADVIKNPLVLEFLELQSKSSYSENELERAIIDKLEQFLLELGKGFLFEARQKRFTFDDDHFYVDLVFYNRLLRCYVLIDLKRDKLAHQDLGQMQMYVNYFDRYVKTDDEAPTIGIVLCHRKNDALVELTLPEDSNIYASKYHLYLPSKEELRKKLLEIEEEVEAQK